MHPAGCILSAGWFATGGGARVCAIISAVVWAVLAVAGSAVAQGCPCHGTLGQGLTVTNGNVSALQGISGDATRIMISAPVQPGNSGGPLPVKGGAVVGVVLSRVSALKMLEATGTLPHNMNFALAARGLVGFLDAAGGAVEEQPGAGHDIADGVPDAIAASVVPVMCHP